MKKVFAIFYFSINFGSFFASLLIPKTLKLFGPAVAFGIPGGLMFLATFIFWLGRDRYTVVPPTGPNPHSFLKVVWAAVKARGAVEKRHFPGEASAKGGASHWLDKARGLHPENAIEGAKAVFRVLLVFLPIPFFWMLFDQKASTWVVQARSMDPMIGPFKLEPSQMQLVNPALVMILIPLTTGVIFPALEKRGIVMRPLWRMTVGMAIGALSYVVAGFIDIPVAAGQRISVLWQIVPYVLLTTAEILVSTTGLEYAYSQAPREMKGTIMSFWNLTVTAANLAVALASALNVFRGSAQFFFYAALALGASVALGFLARRVKQVDWYQQAPAVGLASRDAVPGPVRSHPSARTEGSKGTKRSKKRTGPKR